MIKGTSSGVAHMRRFNALYRFTGFLFGVGFLLLFRSSSSTGVKAVLLLFAVAFLLTAALRVLGFFLVSLPDGHCKRLAVAVALVAASLYYLLHSQSVFWSAFAWLFLLTGIPGVIATLQRILLDVFMLNHLLKSHRRGVSPKLPVPLVYLLAEPGFGVYYSHRLVATIMQSLWRYRHLPAETGLSVYAGPQLSVKRTSFLSLPRQRAMLFILVSDSVRRYSIEFRKWVARQAAAFIALRTPFGIEDPNKRSFDEEARNGFRVTPGPTFDLWVRSRGKGELPADVRSDQVIDINWTVRAEPMGDFIAPLINRLASTAIPTAASDRTLPERLRSLIQEISTDALPPIADCYLRFRLAQSDVERFLSLLDSIECLIRFSAVVLLAEAWPQENKDADYPTLTGGPITLGGWIKLLKELVHSPSGPNELQQEVRRFWTSGILQCQTRLVTRAEQRTLLIPDKDRGTQLEWLEWLNHFRNVTKGHGVIEEKLVSPFWHDLHETFLLMISQMRSLNLSSTVVGWRSGGKEIPLRGWLRDGSRQGHHFLQPSMEQEMFALLKPQQGQPFALYPLVIIRSWDVLVWDSTRNKEQTVEFLNYASGEREQIRLSESLGGHPYRLWREVTMAVAQST